MISFLRYRPDLVIILSTIALMMLGIIFIYSASGPFCQFQNPPKPTWYFLFKQSIWVAAGLVALFAAYRLDYEIVVKLSPVLLILALIGLIAVFPLSGAKIKRWIGFGGFAIQPSEFFKIALVAFLARLAAKYEKSNQGVRKYIPALAVIVTGTALIVREPDLGTTGLVLGVTVVLLYLSGFPKRYLLLFPAAGILVASFLVFVVGYEKDRVDSYLITLENPFDPEAGYQTRQSLVSFGSGGAFGKGLANGGQKHLFLPARHTDFILSAAAEEGGFLIVAVIFGLFGLIALSGYRIAAMSVNIEGALIAWGMMLLIIFQASINIGVALGLLPVTGMTLPFLSYGGSSLVTCSAGIGMIASVARRARSPRRYFKRHKG